MAEKFLVVGATSFYGSNFVKLLETKGELVSTMSLRNWTPKEIDAEYVVNFAAANIVAESWKQPVEYCLVNVVALTELFEAMRKRDIKKYVHVSTPEVYGHHSQPWKPGLCFRPSTPYAVSRAAGDMMVLAYQKAYDFPAVITRTSNIYGPDQPPHRFIPQVIKRLKSGHRAGLHGGGKAERGWIHVTDACEATYRIAKDGIVGQTYHIADKGICSVRFLARRLCELMGKDPQEWLYDEEGRLGNDQCYWLDAAQTRNDFKWKPRIGLEEGLKECVSLISA